MTYDGVMVKRMDDGGRLHPTACRPPCIRSIAVRKRVAIDAVERTAKPRHTPIILVCVLPKRTDEFRYADVDRASTTVGAAVPANPS